MLFDRFRKSKAQAKETRRQVVREEKIKAKKEIAPKGSAVKVPAKKEETSTIQPKKPRPKQKEPKIAPLVLYSPQITEKATELQKGNQYVFKVYDSANKPEIKKAVEEVYGVDVLAVRTVSVPRKRTRLGRTTGWKKGYKKALVTIKKDQVIELMPR